MPKLTNNFREHQERNRRRAEAGIAILVEVGKQCDQIRNELSNLKPEDNYQRGFLSGVATSMNHIDKCLVRFITKLNERYHVGIPEPQLKMLKTKIEQQMQPLARSKEELNEMQDENGKRQDSASSAGLPGTN